MLDDVLSVLFDVRLKLLLDPETLGLVALLSLERSF